MQEKDLNSSFELSEILKKVIQDQPLTVHEHIVLDSWIKEDDKNKEYFQNIKSADYLTDSLKKLYKSNSELQLHLVELKLKQNKTRKIIRYIGIAASFVIVLNIGLVLYLKNREAGNHQLVSVVQNDIPPGTNKATITLSNGKAIELEEHDGVKMTANGLAYDDGSLIVETENIRAARLQTPRGGTYQITLSDGTKVWLNANSTLEYPTTFSGLNREVRLYGEGYFEVHHDSGHPFIVKTDKQQIRVLGTTFNIRTYDEKQYTTLVQGSVSIKVNGSTSTKTLKPNEQAIVNDYSLSIQNVDVSDFVAWKDGLIASSSISLLDLSKEIERWYNVDFVFPKNFKNSERAFVTISKNEKLSSVLIVLEKTFRVKTEIHGKGVIIR